MTEPPVAQQEIQPSSPDQRWDKQGERLHPLTPFIRGWIVLVAIAVYFARELLPDGDPNSPALPAGPRILFLVIAGAVLLAALAGFVSWYFTRFVIDDHELRIESGAVFKSSKKVPFERLQSVDIVQPFAARLFGLAELRMEVGAGDSVIKLHYLTRSEADRLRDYLLTRAHGQHARIGDARGPAASILTDLSVADQRLVTVTPQRLVGSFLLSSEWLMAILGLVVFFAVTSILDVVGVRSGRADPHGHRSGHHDRHPGDQHVQLHPGRVAPRPAGRPRPHQPDQPVHPDQPHPGHPDRAADPVAALRLVPDRRQHPRLQQRRQRGQLLQRDQRAAAGGGRRADPVGPRPGARRRRPRRRRPAPLAARRPAGSGGSTSGPCGTATTTGS